MIDTTITIKGVHVEITTKRQQYIIRQIGPLGRLVDDARPKIDVVIRSIRRPLSGSVCCVMVRLQASSGTYYAVSMSPFFTRAVRDARDEMRRQLSRSHAVETATLEHLRQQAHEKYFVELFA